MRIDYTTTEALTWRIEAEAGLTPSGLRRWAGVLGIPAAHLYCEPLGGGGWALVVHPRYAGQGESTRRLAAGAVAEAKRLTGEKTASKALLGCPALVERRRRERDEARRERDEARREAADLRQVVSAHEALRQVMAEALERDAGLLPRREVERPVGK